MNLSSRSYLLLCLQTVGAVILFWYSVPIYRRALFDPSAHEVRPLTKLIWALASIGLMQGGYWLRHWFNPPPPQFRNAFLGHLIQFVGRLSFVFASSVFGFAFIIRRPELQVPFSRYAILVVGLFAVFCYFQELEQFGQAINGRKHKQ